MNKRYLSLPLFLACLLCAAPAFARPLSSTDKAGTSASAFLKIGAGSPRAQALGNAYVSLADGPEALFWNPAGAAMSKDKELKVGYLDWLQGYKAATVAYVQPFGKTVLGVTGNYMTMDDFDCRGENAISQYCTDVRNFVGSMTLARGFFDNALQLGATAKYVTEDNDGTTYDNFAFDFGAKLKFGRFGLGAALVNFGDKEEVPTGFRGGAHFGAKHWTVSAEVVKYTDYKMQLGVGLEIHITEDVLQVAQFDLRVGYYTREKTGVNYEDSWLENLGLDRTSSVSFGFGLYSSELFGYGVSLDYAMTPFGALGIAQQLAVGIQF